MKEAWRLLGERIELLTLQNSSKVITADFRNKKLGYSKRTASSAFPGMIVSFPRSPKDSIKAKCFGYGYD